ncbi:MAG: murein hydrolase activator EnvC family protein [Bacilli bacterium]
MMKRLSKIIVFIVSMSLFVIFIDAASDNTTLKDLKDKLAEDQAKVDSINKEKDEVAKKIESIEKDLASIEKNIEDCNDKIDAAQKKIEELKTDIELKQLEIDNLMTFKQISEGDNVYLEYIFNAKSFTDFIYRVSIVEQLSKYNDELIDSMNLLIKENEDAKKELNKKIEENEKNIINLNKTLKSYNLSMDDLVDDHKDAKEDLTASKKEVEAYEKLYKQYGCKETDTIIDCIDVPYADGLTRPVTSGSVTSEFGLRLHPTLHYYRMHEGIDIAVPTGTKVYASAAGIVSKITTVANPNKANSSCGGNKVYVKHRINGKEYTTVYMHLHTINVKLNEYVTLNTVIGTSGGGEKYDYCTTGPHLHFGVQYAGNYVNPRNYVSFPAKYVRFTSRWN